MPVQMQKPLSLLFLLIALFYLGAAQAAGGRDPYKYFFHDTFGNLQEELQRAKDEGKKGVLIFFEMDECPFCHRMKETVLNQPEVQEYFRKYFINIDIDIEGDVEINDFSGKALPQKEFAVKVNRVRATPVFGFYDLQGKQVVRYTGATSSVKEFLWLGEYFITEEYKKTKFSRYKRMKKKAEKVATQ